MPSRTIRRWIGALFPLPVTDKIATIEKEDVERATMFLRRTAYFAVISRSLSARHARLARAGVHLHVAAVSKKLYQRNRNTGESRRSERLFWHFVDLVWILCSRFLFALSHE